MKKRIIAIGLAMVMLLGCLAGCASVTCSTSINSDGSGVVSMRFGVTQEALEMAAKTMGDNMAWTDILDESQTVPFTKGGVTYYGSSEQSSFANLVELSKILTNIASSSDAGYTMNFGGLKLTQNPVDKSFELSVKDLYRQDEVNDAVDIMSGGDAARKEALNVLAKGVSVEIAFTFPSPVVQTSGSNMGVAISGNTVTLDAVEMMGAYTFSTSSTAVSNVSGPFSDVPLNAWYCGAVSALAKGGLVNGTGNGQFMPTAAITYSQLCQIIAKAKGLPIGSESSYWAAKAIQSCVSAGYIKSRGDITSANYDVAISREAATSAFMKAIPQSLLVEAVSNPDIPDSASITPEFVFDVTNAYRYGVVKGTGGGTFNPKGILSRAEVCQMLYNIGWASPA